MLRISGALYRVKAIRAEETTISILLYTCYHSLNSHGVVK